MRFFEYPDIREQSFTPSTSDWESEVKRQDSVAKSLPEPRSTTQAAMLDACKTGQLSVLLANFQEHGIHVDGGDGERNTTISWFSRPITDNSGPYPLSRLIVAGILHNQYAIVTHLSQVLNQQGWGLWDEQIMYALLKTQDLKMLDLLRRSTDPDICAWEFNYTVTFLTEACLRGPVAEPLIWYLLDHSAAVGVGFPTDLPLDRATRCGLSMDTIRKMVNTTSPWGESGAAYVHRAVSTAITVQRWDALVYFLGLVRCSKARPCEFITERAQRTKNEWIVVIVESQPCGCGHRGWARRHRATLKLAWMNIWADRSSVSRSNEEETRERRKEACGKSDLSKLQREKADEKEKMLMEDD